MNFWLGLVIGFVGAFVISFGAIVGWWFLLTRGRTDKASKLSADFEEVRERIRNAGRAN